MLAGINEATPKQKFLTLLAQMARITGTELRKDTIQTYDEALRGYGYDSVCETLSRILGGLHQRSPFPSLDEICRILKPETNPAAEALEAAGRICEAISRIGPYQSERFREHVGELAWRVVELSGGCQEVCQIHSKDIAIHRAQWTKLAEAQLIRVAAGLQGVRPALQGKVQSLKQIGVILPEIPKEKS